MKIIRMMLMLLGLYVSYAYGASPEFYGIYASNNNKLIEMAEGNKSPYDFGPNVQFLVYQKMAEMYAGSLEIERAIFVRTVNNPGMDGKQPPKNVNTWKPRSDGAVATRTKPVAGQSEQIYVVPRSPLPTGVYIVSIKGGGGEIGKFYVNKDQVARSLERGEDCIDIVVGSGWASYEYDIGGGGGKTIPCSGSSQATSGNNATPSMPTGTGTNTGASGQISGTQQTNAAKELSKFIDSMPVSEEEEKRLLREEAARAARLNSPDLSRLRQSRKNALKRNDYQGIIDPSLQILQIDPADYESLDYLANLYTAVNDPGKALVYAAECLKRVVRPRTFALITQAYLVKKDKKNTLLWLEKTLQSKYPHHPVEADLNQAFPKDQGEISRIFNKYRTTSGVSTVSPGLAQNQPGAAQNAQSQPNVVEGVASVFKSIIGGVTSALPRQDAAATPSKTSQAVTGAPQAPTSAPASVPPEKAAATASGILESVERRQKVFPPVPDYLYETSSFTGAVSSTWLEMTSGMLGTKGLRDKYEEFYLSAVDYRNLSQVQLIRAKRYAEKGDAETASHFLICL